MWRYGVGGQLPCLSEPLGSNTPRQTQTTRAIHTGALRTDRGCLAIKLLPLLDALPNASLLQSIVCVKFPLQTTIFISPTHSIHPYLVGSFLTSAPNPCIFEHDSRINQPQNQHRERLHGLDANTTQHGGSNHTGRSGVGFLTCTSIQ